ncbi:MAG: hypothetical protein ACRDIC_06030 [bacterium]
MGKGARDEARAAVRASERLQQVERDLLQAFAQDAGQAAASWATWIVKLETALEAIGEGRVPGMEGAQPELLSAFAREVLLGEKEA